MSNNYEETGSSILTGAVIFSTFFLLVAVLASVGAGFTSAPDVTKVGNQTGVETVVVTAPQSKES